MYFFKHPITFVWKFNYYEIKCIWSFQLKVLCGQHYKQRPLMRCFEVPVDRLSGCDVSAHPNLLVYPHSRQRGAFGSSVKRHLVATELNCVYLNPISLT